MTENMESWPWARVLERIDEHAAQTPDRIALVDAQHSMSYAELAAASNELAARLISDIHFFEEDALIVTSPMLRALETALPLIRRAQLPEERVVCHPELFELRSSFPYRERRPSELATELEAEFGLRCCELPDDEAYPKRDEAELEDEAKARVERTWAWLSALLDAERYALVIVIAHGGLISRWLQQLFGPPQGRSVGFMHSHAGLTTLQWDDDEVVIQGLNDSDHVIKGFRVDQESMYRMMLSMLDGYDERDDEGTDP